MNKIFFPLIVLVVVLLFMIAYYKNTAKIPYIPPENKDYISDNKDEVYKKMILDNCYNEFAEITPCKG